MCSDDDVHLNRFDDAREVLEKVFFSGLELKYSESILFMMATDLICSASARPWTARLRSHVNIFQSDDDESSIGGTKSAGDFQIR